jgi:hypothetical protein
MELNIEKYDYCSVNESENIRHKTYYLDLKNKKFDPEYFFYYKNKTEILSRILFVNKNIYQYSINKVNELLQILPNAQYSVLYTNIYNQILSNIKTISE